MPSGTLPKTPKTPNIQALLGLPNAEEVLTALLGHAVYSFEDISF